MLIHYGNYTLKEIYSFFIDCLGVKFTEESYFKNKNKLGISGNTEEIFFGEKGVIETFFLNFKIKKDVKNLTNYEIKNNKRIETIEAVIEYGFFRNIAEFSKDALFNISPDNIDMTPYFESGIYEIIIHFKMLLDNSMFYDTYKNLLSKSGYKYDVIRNWKEEGNNKDLKTFVEVYNHINDLDLKMKLLEHAILLNIEDAIFSLFKMTDKERANWWAYIINEKTTVPAETILDRKNELKEETKTLNEECMKLLQLISYNTELRSYDYIRNSVDTFSKQYPKSSDFYSNWFLGNLLLLESKDEYENKDIILNYYKKAFQYVHFAGASVNLFLEMALTVSIYFETKLSSDLGKVAANKANDKIVINNGLSSVLSRFSKQVYNYSLLLGFNDTNDLNKFSIIFHNNQNFYTIFPKMRNKQSFYDKYHFSKDKMNTLIEQFKKANLRTVKEVVKITEVSYPPIVGLLYYHKNDEAIELLKKFWNVKGKNGYKVIEQPGNNNTTPLINLLTNYRSINKTRKLVYKKMILKLINEYSEIALKLRTNRSTMREPIQEAIHTCDKDIIESILNKCKMNVDSYMIGLDEQSILEYVLDFQLFVPRFNNGTSYSIRDSIKYDRILPIGATKFYRKLRGKSFIEKKEQELNRLKNEMSRCNFNELISSLRVGNSTCKEFQEVSDMIINRSTNKINKAKIDLFCEDRIKINSYTKTMKQ